MIVKDLVYGKIQITDPIILQLIKTKAFQRLKNINQYGGVNFVFKKNYQTSRYDHSIGVWYVLKILGANIEVQIAGLLHDIGHTALSHMVDMAMENPLEDYHERFSNQITGMEEVKKILKKNKIKLKNIDSYSEIKMSLPYVGADRIDYALRDYIYATHTQKYFGKSVLKSVKLLNGKIIFIDPKVAAKYSVIGLKGMWEVIYAPKVAVVYQSLIEIIRDGLNNKWLSGSDLVKDDQFVLNRMLKNKRKYNEIYSKIFRDKFSVFKVKKNSKYDFKHVKLKVRYFDPKVKIDNKLIQLSYVDKNFDKKLKKYKNIFEKRTKGEYFKIKWL